MEKYNGNPNVIIVDPEIHHVKITDDSNDFIVLGCDGIYDRMNTEQSCQDIWAAQQSLLVSASGAGLSPKKGSKPKEFNEQQFHHCCGAGVDSLLVKAMKL
jgi:protein phosphatase 2C family protein 2/3